MDVNGAWGSLPQLPLGDALTPDDEGLLARARAEAVQDSLHPLSRILCLILARQMRQCHWRHLVIGGGAMHGILMAAALCGLFESRMAFHIWRTQRCRSISGTSVGGIIAVALAAGLTPWDILEEMHSMDWSTLLVTDTTSMTASGGSTCALCSGEELRSLLATTMQRRGIDPDWTLADLAARHGCHIRLGIGVLQEDESIVGELWHDRNHGQDVRILTALCATTAIPGVFPAVRDNWGRLVVDGGITCNIPMQGLPLAETLIVRTTGSGSPGMSPPMVAGKPYASNVGGAWLKLLKTLAQGFRHATEHVQTQDAPFVCNVWPIVSSMSLFDLGASPAKRAAAAFDGASSALHMLLAWLAFIHVTRSKMGIFGTDAVQPYWGTTA